MKKKGRKPLDKETLAEDWCFHCKDGGDLLICDYKQCLKAYHCECVGKDNSFLSSKERFICDWHICCSCRKPSSFHCYFCPDAVCERCTSDEVFIRIKGKYGICSHCLKLALLIEENRDVDSDGEEVDFDNLDTMEWLFKEYYHIMSKGLGLNLEVLRAAKSRLRMGRDDVDQSDEYEDSHQISDDDNHQTSDDDNHQTSDEESLDISGEKNLPQKRKSSTGKRALTRGKRKSFKMEFDGWASKSLIQFLSSIGKETSKSLSQQEVTSIIDDYIRQHNLYHPKRKRMIVCDASLRPLLRKKIVNKNRINHLLEAHFYDNQDESEEEEDGLECNQEENEYLAVPCKGKKTMKTEEPKDKNESGIPQSKFAAIVVENIRMVYLKRSIVFELCKQPDTFEDKVTGCFVRAKADPYDFYQRNSHQLFQVSGVKKAANVGENSEIVLIVSGFPREISISALSDADFSEEECEDLTRRVKAGLIKKPTLVELEQKARILHKDITKHFIAKELKSLQALIDRANEKGWRRDLDEYLEKRQLLRTPSEQERLLNEIPRVIPDVEEVLDENYKRDQEKSPTPEDTRKSPRSSPVQNDALLQKQSQQSTFEGEDNILIPSHVEVQPENPDLSAGPVDTKQNLQTSDEEVMQTERSVETPEVIELSSEDEADDKDSCAIIEELKGVDPESKIWHISSTDGNKSSKFSLSLLKKWSEASPFARNFKVWKEDQSADDAIWLRDAIKLAFPKG